MKIRPSVLLSMALIISGFSNLVQADTSVDWNISTNPLAFILGPNLRLEYKLDEHWTVSPEIDLIYFNLAGVKANGVSGGLLASYYFKETYVSGWVATLGASYGSLRLKATDSNGNVDSLNVNNFSVTGLGGYSWFWGNFNLALGLGLSTNSAATSDITDQNGNKVKSVPLGSVAVAGNAALGWTF